jgi:hypothetical protein
MHSSILAALSLLFSKLTTRLEEEELLCTLNEISSNCGFGQSSQVVVGQFSKLATRLG